MVYGATKGELVTFQTSDGLILHGFLVRAKRRSNKALVHIHGLEGTFYGSYFSMELAKKVSKAGFNFLSIELRGSYTENGIRKKKGKKLQWFTAGGGIERFEDCTYDISGAIRFLGKMGINRIYLEGHSTGCQKIVYYQYKKRDRRVKALVLLAPADDYNLQKKELGRRFKGAVTEANRLYRKDGNARMPKKYIKRSFSARRFLSFSDLRFVEGRIFNYELPRLREFGSIKQPVLAIFGDKDEGAVKPVKEYMRILGENTGSRKFNYYIIKNANHGFAEKEEKTSSIVTNWLKGIE